MTHLRTGITRVRQSLKQLREDLLDLNRSAPGITFETVGSEIHAKLQKGAVLPIEVEQRCDLITRVRDDGTVEWLKNRDNVLPT